MLPIKYSVELEEPDPLEDEPDPLEDDPEPLDVPDPPLTLEPPGRVRVAPLVENTMVPDWSVRYTDIPAELSLVSASEVGCP